MAETEELELAPADYPNLDDVPLAEKRRAWIIHELCDTAEGPLFDTMLKLAKDTETFLIFGAVPDGKSKPVKVVAKE